MWSFGAETPRIPIINYVPICLCAPTCLLHIPVCMEFRRRNSLRILVSNYVPYLLCTPICCASHFGYVCTKTSGIPILKSALTFSEPHIFNLHVKYTKNLCTCTPTVVFCFGLFTCICRLPVLQQFFLITLLSCLCSFITLITKWKKQWNLMILAKKGIFPHLKSFSSMQEQKLQIVNEQFMNALLGLLYLMDVWRFPYVE